MTKELVEYAEQFLRLGYRIAEENAYATSDIEKYGEDEKQYTYVVWKDSRAELEKAVEGMKKATLGQESSQLEFDWDIIILRTMSSLLLGQES